MKLNENSALFTNIYIEQYKQKITLISNNGHVGQKKWSWKKHRPKNIVIKTFKR
jgi:hypothetical protein